MRARPNPDGWVWALGSEEAHVLHAWVEPQGVVYWRDHVHRALCGRPDPIRTRPLRRQLVEGDRRCARCEREAARLDQEMGERVIGPKLAARWPRPVGIGDVRRAYPRLRQSDAAEALMAGMVARGLAVAHDGRRGRRYWTARRALVERHGGVYGMT